MPIPTKLHPNTQTFLARSPHKLLIDGEWMPALSGETTTSINPSDGTKLAEIASAGREDVERARDILLAALQGGLPALESYPAAQRDEIEERLRGLPLRQRYHIAGIDCKHLVDLFQGFLLTPLAPQCETQRYPRVREVGIDIGGLGELCNCLFDPFLVQIDRAQLIAYVRETGRDFPGPFEIGYGLVHIFLPDLDLAQVNKGLGIARVDLDRPVEHVFRGS